MKTAVYIMNRTPSRLLNGKTPFEKLYGCVPSFKNLQVFGCLAYAHNIHHRGDKFATRSRRCVFLGYPSGKKGWLLPDLEKQNVFTSRDVVICENQFPFETVLHVSSPATSSPTPELGEVSFDDSDSDSVDTTPELNIDVENTIPVETEHVTLGVEPRTNEPVTPDEIAQELLVPVLQDDEQLGRSLCTNVPSSRLCDYIVNTVNIDNSHSLSHQLHHLHSCHQVRSILYLSSYHLIIFLLNIIVL